MAIETLQDLNAQSCCCDLPACPIPAKVCQSISVNLCGFPLPANDDISAENACKLYTKKTVTDSRVASAFSSDEGGTFSFEYSEESVLVYEKVIVDGVCTERFVSGTFYSSAHTIVTTASDGTVQDDLIVISTSAGPDEVWTGTLTYTNGVGPGSFSDPDDTVGVFAGVVDASWTYTSPATFTQNSTFDVGGIPGTVTWIAVFSEVVDADAVNTLLDNAIADLDDPDVWPGTSCQTEFPCGAGNAVRAKVTFSIPNTWTDPIAGAGTTFPGTYFLITYDILDEPSDWTEGDPGRTFFLEDQTIEWAGPGSGDADDPSWLLSPITLALPTLAGHVRRIVNIRYVCRENWYIGVVPEVIGEAVTLE